MKASKIFYEEILKTKTEGAEIDFGNTPIHYEKVMELVKLGYKVPQDLIDYKDDEIQEDEDNPFFTDEFVRHVEENYLQEVKLNITKENLEFAREHKLNLSELLNAAIEEKMKR